MMLILPIKAVLLIFFLPNKFVALSVLHDVTSEFETNKQLLEQYPNRVLPPERLKNFEDNAWDRTKKIRVAFFRAYWLTIIAVLFGLIFGCFANFWFGKPSGALTLTSILQVLSAGMILAATLAMLGWEIQSCKGSTLPEKTNRWLFRAQYWLGTVLFVFSQTWSN